MIFIKNVSKSFADKDVLIDTNLEIKQGSKLCIMGNSGCGKTTLINIILGFQTADKGTVVAVPEKRSVVFQEDRLCEDYSALSNVKMVIKGKAEDKRKAEEILTALGLGDALNKPVKDLSGGMKRRVAIARALAADFEFIVLDEPFKGLDESTKSEVISYAKKALNGKTVLMITHDIEEAKAFDAEIYEMKDFGKIQRI